MAELIPDGYTLASKLKSQGEELTVLSRPLPLRQARLILKSVQQLPQTESRQLLMSQLRERIASTCSEATLRSMGVSELQDAARKLLCPSSLEADAENLRTGLVIEIDYPHLAEVTCRQCRDWWFDPLDGTLVYDSNHQPTRRPDPDDVLCETATGCPKGHHTKPITLSEKNRQAWIHFQECDATGVFPNDPMVAHNANIIRDVLKDRRRAQANGVGRGH